MIFINIEKLLQEYYGFDNYAVVISSNSVQISCLKKKYYLYCFDNADIVYDTYRFFNNVCYCYKFIRNRDNKLYTFLDNKIWALLLDLNYEFSVDFLLFPWKMGIVRKLDWKEKWQKKSDYIEQFYSKISGKYKLIDESIHYYLNMLEVSITYLNQYDNYFGTLYSQHKKMNLDEFFNPFNFIFDFKERDIAEYLKYIFFTKQYNRENIEKILLSSNYEINYDLLIARLLFPNYYFCLFDNIVLNLTDECELNNILFRREEYEKYVKMIFDVINNVTNQKKYHFI